MKNKDKPAMPISVGILSAGEIIGSHDFSNGEGLTKHEYACIKLKMPETGDEDLDALIAKAQRKELAGLAMQGILANDPLLRRVGDSGSSVYARALKHADALLEALEEE